MAAADIMIFAKADSTWRASTHHITYEVEGRRGGQCYIDFVKAGSSWSISNSSFDGEGCCSTKFDGIPEDVAAAFFKGINKDGDSRELSGVEAQGALASLRGHFASRRGDVPEHWQRAFETFRLLEAA